VWKTEASAVAMLHFLHQPLGFVVLDESMPPTTLDSVIDRLLLHEENAREAHKRLRETLIEIGERLDKVQACQDNIRREHERMKTAMNQPPDLTRGFLPTRFWVTIFAATLSIAATIIGAAYSVKSDVRDQATLEASESRLNDERISNLRQAIDDLKKSGELQRIQLESLTKMVIQQRKD
jgi:hypothetical protein